MRPELLIRDALLASARALTTPDRAPTLLELATHAQVGLQSARDNVPKLKARGHLRIARTRRVDYRNRPVAEYEPAHSSDADAQAGFVDLGQAISAWLG